jgi:hypothetical protein
MVKAAGANGWIDATAVASNNSPRCDAPGADFVLTYFAREIADGARRLSDTNERGSRGRRRSYPAALIRRCVRFAPWVARPTPWRRVRRLRRGRGGKRATSISSSPTARRCSVTRTPTSWRIARRGQGRHDVRCAHARRGAARRNNDPARRRARTGATRLVGYRGGHECGAPREGRHGRDKIVKFDGCYHGHSDALLVAGGSGVAQMGLPGSAGVTAGAVADTIVAPYNVVPELDDSVAAVLVEPVAANMNLVAPHEGLPPGTASGVRPSRGAPHLRRGDHRDFASPSRARGQYFGVTPDLWCFGKVIGGGLPVGAFGGSRALLLSSLAPLGPVYQAGTLSGNPLATAAGGEAAPPCSDAVERTFQRPLGTVRSRNGAVRDRRWRAIQLAYDEPGGL